MDVYFSHHIFDRQTYGGISRYCTELHRGLRRAGMQSRIAAGLHINAYLDEVDEVWGARVSKRAGTNTARLQFNRCTDSLLRALLPETAIYHVTFHDRVVLPKRARLAFTVHDLIRERVAGPEAFAQPLSTRKRSLAELADVVFTVSHCTKRDLVELFDIPADKIFVTHLGTSFSRFTDVRPDDALAPYVLYVGARQGAADYKNFAQMVRALSSSRVGQEANLVCFGGGEFTSEQVDLLDRCGLRERTHLMKGDDRCLARLFAGARCLVYPSLYEGFGLPPLEAMTMGCPVVCSERSSIPEVVGSAAVFFDPEDVESMSSAIEQVYFDNQLRTTLSRRGRERSRQFQWSTTVKKTLDGYHYALQRKTAR
ncbi:glycosyltransferase family 4 protein [Persicimonas caeni]|uniref:Glycosyltransferase family 4 protein n=1 Tax=Persicimonas caeni TaxID=2292766 RepID=A0A4Y6PTT2_PERCE|nr:glycosyltransferase family 1 protein [Persicimonas caeni]QDG51708.1 glycosyltransferase family 4 protein [Persicimonas caeni]QED32929.1 glycosyltransferase family 4 protein [Persicimonas caeni]